MENYGTYLTALRHSARLSQKALAELSEISISKIKDIELGKVPNPRLDTRFRLEKTLEAWLTRTPSNAINPRLQKRKWAEKDCALGETIEVTGVTVKYQGNDIYTFSIPNQRIRCRVQRHRFADSWTGELDIFDLTTDDHDEERIGFQYTNIPTLEDAVRTVKNGEYWFLMEGYAVRVAELDISVGSPSSEHPYWGKGHMRFTPRFLQNGKEVPSLAIFLAQEDHFKPRMDLSIASLDFVEGVLDCSLSDAEPLLDQELDLPAAQALLRKLADWLPSCDAFIARHPGTKINLRLLDMDPFVMQIPVRLDRSYTYDMASGRQLVTSLLPLIHEIEALRFRINPYEGY